jgi:membrane protein implicated in regulation of membrane protease activity
MGAVYLASLVVGLGVLLLQVAMGGKGDPADNEAGGEAKSLDAHDAGVVALFLSTRFWIFTLLGFGLSGGLIHALSLAGPIVTFVIAAAAGFSSGTFASYAFRAVRRSSSSTTLAASDAVGQIGRVLVAVAKGKTGQVRVAVRGHSVDLLATTEELEIARGEQVLVEDVQGTLARVSRRPVELAD